MSVHDYSNASKLKPKALVYHTKYDGDSAIPAMNVTIYALPTGLPEVQMLKDTHGGLDKNDHAGSQQANNYMCRDWGAPREEVQFSSKVDTQTHSAYHNR